MEGLRVGFAVLGQSPIFPIPEGWYEGYPAEDEFYSVASQHIVDFSGELSSFCIKILSNPLPADITYTVYINGAATDLSVTVYADELGVFPATGKVAAFSAGDVIVGVADVPPLDPVAVLRIQQVYLEMTPTAGYRQVFRTSHPASIDAGTVPPPAWATIPLAGNNRHYRSDETMRSVVGDISETRKPLQMLCRAPGVFSSLQAVFDETNRSCIVRMDIDGFPEPDDDPLLSVAITAENLGTGHPVILIDEDGAQTITNGQKASLTAYDQPVGTGSNVMWSSGVNWRGAIGNRLIDVQLVEQWNTSYGRGGDYDWVNYVRQLDGERRWITGLIGAYDPKVLADVEAETVLGRSAIEITPSFDMDLVHLRAYMDLNVDGEVITIEPLVDGAQQFADNALRIHLLDPGWYEDTTDHFGVGPGESGALMVRAPLAASSAIAHISTVCYSYGERRTRECSYRDLPAAVEVVPGPCLTHRARCVKITRVDGQVFAYTDHNRDIIYDGVTYKARGGFKGSATELGAVLGDVGNMEIGGFTGELGISVADLFGGQFDGATVVVQLIPWGDYVNTEDVLTIGGGTIGKTEQNETGFRMEALSLSAYLKQRALLSTFTPSCRFALGDSRCTVDVSALEVSGSVTALTDSDNPTGATVRRHFFDSARTEEDNYFDEGLITFTSGANAGQTSKVKTFGATEVTLWEPLVYVIAAGDAYTMTPGCDKLTQTCKDKFDNFVNFGGFPTIPGVDATAQTPSGKP